MIIISWDVGVLHLAYCIMSYTKDSYGNNKIEILDWREVNLIENERLILSCCGLQKKDKLCGKKACYYLESLNKGFCKTHLDQHKDYWSKKDIEQQFTNINETTCNVLLKNKQCCNKKAKISRNGEINLCNQHYKSKLSKDLKNAEPKLIKNLTVKEFKTDKLQLNLINKLDNLLESFAALKIEQVVIE
ncbi:hypothetical protein EON73_03300, partial [bacterium]